MRPSPDTDPRDQGRVQRWRRYLRHFDDLGDVLTFAGIGAGLVGIALPLRLLGVRRTASRLARTGGPRLGQDRGAERLRRAERLAAYCDIWLRRLRPINPCLRRSLLLLALLRRDGLPLTLVIGIRADRMPEGPNQPLAHAWLEFDGAPVLERNDPREHHRPNLRFPSATA